MEASLMPRISKRLIDTAPLKDTDYFIWDSDMPGFGLRVMASGKKSFMVQYRHGGRTRRVTFGRAGVMTPDEARKEARNLLTVAGKGASPADDIQNYRKTPTVADICDRFMTEYVPTHCKASTESEYQRAMDLFIKPTQDHGYHPNRDCQAAPRLPIQALSGEPDLGRPLRHVQSVRDLGLEARRFQPLPPCEEVR